MAKKILLVDDSKFVRNIIKMPLAKAGYEVIDRDGPDSALTHLQGDSVALVITDLKMPQVLDGLNFLKKLQKTHASTPVVVFSSDTDLDREKALLASGVRAFFKKPMPAEELLEKVKGLIGNP